MENVNSFNENRWSKWGKPQKVECIDLKASLEKDSNTGTHGHTHRHPWTHTWTRTVTHVDTQGQSLHTARR